MFLCGLLLFLLIIYIIIYSCWLLFTWMNDAERLPISKLILIGNIHFTKNEDIKKVIFSLGKPKTFMTIDINVIKNKIIMIPWIHKTIIRKQWPDKLKIYIEEYIPYAIWNDKNVIDKNGNIFNIPHNEINKNNYVFLYSPPKTQKYILSEYKFLKNILDLHKIKLKSFSISQRYAWKIVLDNDIRIELGKKNLLDRLNRFIELYPIIQQTTDKQINYIDFRYPNGAAVGYKLI